MTPMIKVKISIEFMVPPVVQVVLVSRELYVLFGNFMQGNLGLGHTASQRLKPPLVMQSPPKAVLIEHPSPLTPHPLPPRTVGVSLAFGIA
jgi:hypothetical protein